jgi:hypothetical protein
VAELLQLLLPTKLLALLLKPLVRVILGVIAVPLFQLFLHRVVKKKDLNAELERDISLWLRGSLMLLIATANMEGFFFKWVPPDWREDNVWLIALRLMLAIGVIEGMPDQALFAIIHPGPPKPVIHWRRPWARFKEYLPKFLLGLLCQHLNRSSPVLAILTVFFPGTIGWVCYGLAITNYLIIGLVSSRDRAIDALRQFDRAVAERREELIEDLEQTHAAALSPSQQVDAAERGGPFAPEPNSSPAE